MFARSSILIFVVILSWGGSASAFPPALLGRPDGTVIEPFPVPDGLRAPIHFWTKIFSRYTTEEVVLHDREDLSVIWEVVELPEDEDGTLDVRAGSKLVKKRIAALQKRLRRLQRHPAPRDDEDEIVLALVGGDKKRIRGAWARIRGQRGVADNFRQGLRRAEQWLPEVRRILDVEEVPRELGALPFVESMFNPLARSSAGAAGLWQLMPSTARDLGLDTSAKNDERLDVVKATHAAAQMLRANYEMLGTWPLAITGYNHGPYGLARAVAKVGSTDIGYLIEHNQGDTWGFASKNFYAEFIAVSRLVAAAFPPEPTVVGQAQKVSPRVGTQ